MASAIPKAIQKGEKVTDTDLRCDRDANDKEESCHDDNHRALAYVFV